MKKLKPLLFSVTLMAVWLLASSDAAPHYHYAYTPWFMDRSELQHSVFWVAGERDMDDPGKIWVHGDRIFVNERYRGVHIIDNSDPSNPKRTGFIMAPGCLDMAVKGNIIYLDNSVDLVAFDMASNNVTERIPGFFPEPLSPAGERYLHHSSEKVLVGWKKKN